MDTKKVIGGVAGIIGGKVGEVVEKKVEEGLLKLVSKIEERTGKELIDDRGKELMKTLGMGELGTKK